MVNESKQSANRRWRIAAAVLEPPGVGKTVRNIPGKSQGKEVHENELTSLVQYTAEGVTTGRAALPMEGVGTGEWERRREQRSVALIYCIFQFVRTQTFNCLYVGRSVNFSASPHPLPPIPGGPEIKFVLLVFSTTFANSPNRISYLRVYIYIRTSLVLTCRRMYIRYIFFFYFISYIYTGASCVYCFIKVRPQFSLLIARHRFASHQLFLRSIDFTFARIMTQPRDRKNPFAENQVKLTKKISAR